MVEGLQRGSTLSTGPQPAEFPLPADLDLAPVVFRDGLGERHLHADRRTGTLVELWRLRPELAAYRTAVTEQARALDGFEHPRFARVRGVVTTPEGRLTIVSDHVPGLRLSALQQLVRDRQEVVDVDAALYIARSMLRALGAFEERTDLTHGAVGLERTVLTPRGRLVLLEPVLGTAFERIGLAAGAVWRLCGVARPLASPGASHPDVVQVAVALLSLLLGRPLARDEYPDLVDRLLLEAAETTPLGRTRPLSEELREWLDTALGRSRERGFRSRRDARAAFEGMIARCGFYTATRDALVALVERIGEAPRDLVRLPVGAPAGAPAYAEEAPAHRAPAARADSTDQGLSATEPVVAPEPIPTSVTTEAPAVGADGQSVAAVAASPVSAQLDTHAAIASRDHADRPASPIVVSTSTIGLAPAGTEQPVASVASRPPVGIRLKDAVEPRPTRPAAEVPTTNDAIELARPDALPSRGANPSRRRWLRAAAAVLMLAAVDGQALRLAPWPRKASSEPVAAAPPAPSAARPSTGGLHITTDPPGARVTVDGTARGLAPLVISDLAPGRHTVLVESERGTVRRTVRIQANETTTLHVAVFAGFLAVSAPIELQIFEDGQLLGTAGSGQMLLAPGRHELEFVNEALAFRHRRAVEIRPGALAAVVVEPPPGTVHLDSTPPAEVWIDGQRIGETPLADVAVPIGTREVVFKHPTLGERREVITVTAAGPVRVAVTFAP